MRKLLVGILLALILVGCSAKKDSQNDLMLQRYIFNYTNVIDNTTYQSFSNFYDIDVAVNKVEGGQYRYDIIIDNPRIAMYNIEVIAVENNIAYAEGNKLMPSIGIVDNGEYNLIPYQVNIEEGYMRGIIVGGIIDSPSVQLKLKISWKDYSKINQTTEYIELNVVPQEEQVSHDENEPSEDLPEDKADQE